MTRSVAYAPAASDQLLSLYEWIADQSGFPERAHSFVTSVMDFCEELGESPFRGTARDDLRPGMRVIGFRRRIAIAFAVEDNVVQILGIYYGGRNYESLFTGRS